MVQEHFDCECERLQLVQKRQRRWAQRGGVCLYISESIDSFELSDAGFNLSKITDDELDLKEPFIGQTTLDLYEEEIEERSNKIGKSLKFVIHFKIILLTLICLKS